MQISPPWPTSCYQGEVPNWTWEEAGAHSRLFPDCKSGLSHAPESQSGKHTGRVLCVSPCAKCRASGAKYMNPGSQSSVVQREKETCDRQENKIKGRLKKSGIQLLPTRLWDSFEYRGKGSAMLLSKRDTVVTGHFCYHLSPRTLHLLYTASTCSFNQYKNPMRLVLSSSSIEWGWLSQSHKSLTLISV